MGIENLKQWHWIIIGVFVGVVIAYVHLNMEPTYPRTIGQTDFERDLVAADVGDNQPRIRDIVVHPEMPADKTAYKKPMQVLTFQRATMSPKDGAMVYLPYAYRAELPYKPLDGSESAGSIVKYLEQTKAQEPSVSFKIAWWEEPKWTLILWTMGSVIIIGGIWPLVIRILIGAGLARAPKVKDDYDLSRFGKGKDAKKPELQKELSAAEMDQLGQVTDDIERDLAESATAGGGAATAVQTEAPVKKLDSGPLEIKTAQQEQEDKEYKGEYYPVAKTKHHDEQKPL